MAEKSTEWHAIPNITDGFDSISFRKGYLKEAKQLHVCLHGKRTLLLRFTNLVALQFEDEAPGNFPIPQPWPMLRKNLTFPLLKIEDSQWRAQWIMYRDVAHYVLISSDDLLHVLAGLEVGVQWQSAGGLTAVGADREV